MNIAFSIDDNYAPHCATTICSICENNRDEIITFYIVHNGLSKNNIEIISNFVHKYSLKEIFFLTLSKELIDLCPIGKDYQLNNQITIATYYRLFFEKVIPTNVDKLIFLDCDIVVEDSLKELWNIDLTNKAIAAVPDTSTYDIQYYNRLKYEYELGYFNAGVLLINLKYWRENNLMKVFIEYMKMYPERLVCHDQDVLNYTLRNLKIRLPYKFNYQGGFYSLSIPLFYKDWNEIFEFESKPTIIHYSNRLKPWFKDCTHPLKSEYIKYRKLTPYSNFKLKNESLKICLKKILKKILILLTLKQKEQDFFRKINV